MKKQQSGFTLVEIAIVMVIIGLLLGGVLKGQEVITNAKIKNINNDVSGVSAAIYSYQDRYNTLPGDDAAAAAHVNGGISNAAAGDGIIDGAYNAAGTSPAVAANTESTLVWHHLRSAGLLSGDPLSSIAPNHAFGGSIGVQTGVNAVTIAPGVNGLSSILIGFTAIPADMAVILDSQADDNDPDAGSIRASAGIGAYDLVLNPVYDIMFEL